MWIRRVRRPQCDCTILVADMHYRVMRILGKSGGRTHLGAQFRDDLASGDVLILEVSWITLQHVRKGEGSKQGHHTTVAKR